MGDEREVARLLQRFVDGPRPCSYLPEQEATLEIRIQVDVTPLELEAMLERGWRRFGAAYFRPVCGSCRECVTLRIDTMRFTPTRSQRRAAKNAARLRRLVSTPVVDDERLSLYRRWHADREEARGWEESSLDADRYWSDFAFPHPAVREVAFRDPADGDRLVGLGICDATPGAWSAAFFFWDPEHAPPSLGVAHVLALVEDAKSTGVPWVYLGYRVLGCASLRYKARYGPHELLHDRPGSSEAPAWRAAPADDGDPAP